jgi:hypothetical protein
VEQWFKLDEAMINPTKNHEKETWAKKVVLNLNYHSETTKKS